MTKLKRTILFGVVTVVAVIAVTAGAKWLIQQARSSELLELYGGPEGFAVVQKAERVEACRLNHDFQSGQAPSVTEGPIAVPEPIASQLVSTLSSRDAYGWDYAKPCIPVWGVRLAFYRDTDRIEILLCFQCDILSVSLNGVPTTDEDFDPIRPQLVRAVQAIFLKDQEIQALPEISE